MLAHKGTQILQTARLTLRRFTVDDAEAMYNNWANDERVTRYLTWQPHESPAATRQLLEQWCAIYEQPDKYNWAIEYEGEPIGNISVVRCDDKSERVDLGYCMGCAYWNRGIMTEAVSAVTNFLFSEVGVNRIEISHAVKNPASGRVAEKCGFRFEGTKREYFKAYSGEFLDISYRGLVRSDWQSK